MNLSTEDIKKLGQLARLKLTEKEIAQYRTELGGILRYVDQLAKAKFPKAPKGRHAPDMYGGRGDRVQPWPEEERAAALEQAHGLNKGQLKVKRILG